MILIKNNEEIKIMREAGRILAKIIDRLIKEVRPGISTFDLEILARQLMKEYEVESAFFGYLPDTSSGSNQIGYPAVLCASVNDEVVHAIPSKTKILRSGDIIGLDCGIKYKNFYSDMSKTVGVGKISPEAKKLIKVTEEALMRGIKKIKAGIHLGDISEEIQNHAEKNGFSVVRDLTGHGVGRKLHEPPVIFNYGVKGTGPVLEAGMTLAIEPMVNAGSFDVKELDNRWTIVTADGSLSAHFEHTVLVTKKGSEVLTKK